MKPKHIKQNLFEIKYTLHWDSFIPFFNIAAKQLNGKLSVQLHSVNIQQMISLSNKLCQPTAIETLYTMSFFSSTLRAQNYNDCFIFRNLSSFALVLQDHSLLSLACILVLTY